MPTPPKPEDESRRVLEGVARDAETVGTSSLARVSRRVGTHFSGADAIGEGEDGGTDPVEVWGRRVGRALSVVLAIGLTWLLGHQLGWW